MHSRPQPFIYFVAAMFGMASLQVFAQPAAPEAPSSAVETPAASTARLPAPLEYRLSPGDLVKITVYQNADLSIEARVAESGYISYPLLGAVKVAGLTISQAEYLIAEGLRVRDVMKQPQVSMLVAQVRGNQASVLGQVNRPGRFPIEIADMRLSDLIATAGGIAVTGADRVILTGVRDDKPYRMEIDLPLLFQSNRRGEDVLIKNGDVVYVERAPQVYIYGEVQKPGAYRLERNMTVMQALASGGGLTQRGTERRLRVHRPGPDGKIQVLQPALDDLLRDGDVVYIRESLI